MTKDLFKDYDPEPVVERFDEEKVKAFDPDMRLAKAISQALSEANFSRDEIAERMGDLLHETITKSMLDNWAAPTRAHPIHARRLAALCRVIDDVRPLNELLGESRLIVVPQRYEHLLRRERARELVEKMEQEAKAADAQWRATR